MLKRVTLRNSKRIHSFYLVNEANAVTSFESVTSCSENIVIPPLVRMLDSIDVDHPLPF